MFSVACSAPTARCRLLNFCFVLYTGSEDNFYEEQEEFLGNPVPRSSCTITNSSNPMDSVGIMHNYLLGLIEDEVSIQDDSFEDIFDVSDSILIAQYDSSIVPYLISDTMYASHISDAMYDDSTMVTSYIDTLDLTDAAKDKLEELFAIIWLYDGTNLCTVVDSIKTFELTLGSIPNTTDLSIIRSASSVARHSLDYWDGRITEDGVQSRIKIKLKIRINLDWGKAFVVFADVAGAVSGGITGSATVVGAISLGTTMGVGSSLGASKLVDWWKT